MPSGFTKSLTDKLASFAAGWRNQSRDQLNFTKIEWANQSARAWGNSSLGTFKVTLRFDERPYGFSPACSICGEGRFCPHVSATAKFLEESGVAAKIEESEYAPTTFSFSDKIDQKPAAAWKSQLGNLARQLSYYAPSTPTAARFPAGREAIYIVELDRFAGSDDSLDISVGTRPADPAKWPEPSDESNPRTYHNSIYRNFTAGVRALAASADPLDREIAEKMLLAGDAADRSGSRNQLQFSIPMQTQTDLLARLARSGRLFFNSKYSLHDGVIPLTWLSDEPFELKFEIATCDPRQLSLGGCAVNSQITIGSEDLRYVEDWFFVDKHNRLGLFRKAMPKQLFAAMKTSEKIVVPREHAGDLIERVMSIPVGLGIEFVGCDDIRPERVAGTPKPRIHIKAGSGTGTESGSGPAASGTLEAKVHFDYDGVMIPFTQRAAEFYDKRSRRLVQVDAAFHQSSEELLYSLGVKLRKGYGEPTLSLGTKKLPALVARLIHSGWHVEADGKLYRTASKFNLSVVSNIDWFELQGKAHFDQTSIGLPQLIQALRSGEKTVVLDDGTVGVIPEEWLKRFSGLAELATSEDGAIKFGRSQVGLLDALLAEQGEINVDEKFAAARESLRAFDQIQPHEPPGGFIGTLRPYQKLAQGWFDFLRQMGFGGCLADDMGLGKTIQVLSLLEHRREHKSGPSLIVVPRSLIFNWIAEARKFAPELRVLDQSHSQRRKGTEHLVDFDLVLTTYGTLRRDAAFLKDFEFDYVILDEAQAIKNADTEASKAVRLLQGRHKLALSGTPIENHLGELWSLFDFLNPGMLGRIGRFSGLAQKADADERKLLAAAVRPFILRRTKKQVAPELPERVEQTIIVELDADQRKAYDELREYYRQKLLNKIDTDGIGKSQMIILEALLRLRQAACHPGLIDKSRISEPSAKLDELLTRLSSAIESGERVLVFSQFTSLLAIVKHRLKQANIEFLYLDGKTKNRQELVEVFQSGEGPSIFLISLKAGGVGLNLTAARTVYLLDPWWNPAVEAQAIDRTHRIGQQQTVFATRLITADTVEQKVLELQAKKKGLADAIVNADNAGISSLTREDLELLLA
jgi:hypothetical protein